MDTGRGTSHTGACCGAIIALVGLVLVSVIAHNLWQGRRRRQPAAVADLAPTHWVEAAEAIMTTDTLPKAVSRRVKLGGGACMEPS